eukprot:CAMPEP_0172181610 /NCGR_PEP_ID=MMETSP1050-20130122/17920_1 /TAXON_ID=233186 /ORGANISM="Cryptomonas curvata, Strain CCAP979/52" /LENGTH=114 /DNA_ID=CAMNT_0012854925 /DNA_START=379 /DNA_END=720 /DNA_ORIENTATION=-
MNHAQATEIIQTCSRIASASAPAHADASPHVAPLRLHQTDLDAAAARHDPHHDVRRGVLRRLAALRDRISAAGAAVLPPSCAAMGPPFLPALDFLSTLILDSDADAESSPTAAA